MAKDPKKRKRGSIEGAFAWRLIEMLESPAYRVLTLSAHRVMARLEIEMAHHGGKPEENGRLPCTFEHFVEFGVERHAIAPAIRELVALGFVEITRKGCAGNAGFRQPALYRLTYRHCGSHKETTDEWRRIKTMEEAEAIAKRARAPQSERRQKNKSPVRETPPIPVRENPPIARRPQCGKTHYGPSGETHTTSISPGVGPLPDTGDDPTPLSLRRRSPRRPSRPSKARMARACRPRTIRGRGDCAPRRERPARPTNSDRLRTRPLKRNPEK